MALTKFDVWKTILIILVLNILLPSADVTTDLVLIFRLFRGVSMCEWSEGIRSDYKEYFQCRDIGPETYCSAYPEKVSNQRVCGLSHHCGEDLSEEESDVCRSDTDRYSLILTGTV